MRRPTTPRRNAYLTAGMHRILCLVRDSEDEAVVFEKGAGWWVDEHQVAGRCVWALLRLCLLKETTWPGSTMYRYEFNSESTKVLEDPDYVPMIVRALASGQPVVG